ncbi:putative reverse transcriptase domain-containing protein [Tanacetum coccineum]
MAFFVISISSDLSEESVGTSTAQVILFGMIPATISTTAPTIDLPIIHDDTPLIPTDTPTILSIVPTISPTVPTIPSIAPTIPYTSLFICIGSSDRQPIPIGRPYRTQPNEVLQMSTARKRVGPLPTHRLALRYSTDYSSSDQFTSEDSSRDSLSDSSSETSSDSHSDSSSDSSLRHSSSGYGISDSPYDLSSFTSARPSRKRCRNLSPIRADLLPPPKRIKDFDSVTDFEVSSENGYELYVSREVGLGVDVEDSYEPYTELDVDTDVQIDINECFAYADAIRARGTNVRDVVETTAAEEVKSSMRGTIEFKVNPRVRPVVDDDMCESVREDVPYHVITDEAVKVTYETLRDLVQRFHDHTRSSALERDNTRLRGMLDVESQRVGRLQHSLSRAQRELSKDKNGREENKRTGTGNAFAITANPIGRENTGHLAKDYRGMPRNVNPINARNLTVRACYECGSTDHVRSACPRLNRAQGPEENRPNQVVANNGGQGRGNQGNQARASGQLVEIDKVIKGCKLEIEGHVFDIDLIPFGHRSFDVIIGMDWLSNHKAEIICHEKVVRIPLSDGKVLRVLGERPEEKARLLMSAKASDKKQEEIVMVRDFPEVFPDDLSGLPPL